MKPNPTMKVVHCFGNFDNPAGNRRYVAVELPSSRPISAIASRITREPEFPAFLASIGYHTADEEAITAVMCEICSISSRAELDRDVAAANRFRTQIFLPYMAYRLANIDLKRGTR